jgi:hypothetical protein
MFPNPFVIPRGITPPPLLTTSHPKNFGPVAKRVRFGKASTTSSRVSTNSLILSVQLNREPKAGNGDINPFLPLMLEQNKLACF